jgi:serine/threonine protein kinase
VADPHNVDIRADLYSLGCSFYEMLIGQPPFPKGTPVEKLMAHRTREPTALQELRPEVPAAVAAVVGRLMAKKPEARYAKPGDVSACLAGILVRMDAATIDWGWRPPAVLEAGAAPVDNSAAAAPPWWSNQYGLVALVVFVLTFILFLVAFR